MHDRVKNDLESLSKDLYLDNTDLWIEFKDRRDEDAFDELVLFLATKFNYISIVKYAIDNNIIDLFADSKHQDFNNIYNHLLFTAQQINDHEIYNYLLTHSKYPTNNDIVLDKEPQQTTDITHDIPSFRCSSCNSNIFESGYIISDKKVIKYCSDTNSLAEVSHSLDNEVICNTCNNSIYQVTPSSLEAICNINLCNSCGYDLRDVGITDKKNMTFDKDTSSFILSDTEYTCSNCSTPLEVNQKNQFNLE